MIKLEDLHSITNKETKLIKHAWDTSSMYNEKIVVLHIVDRDGIKGKSKHLEITKCNRVVDFWEHGLNWGKIEQAKDYADEREAYYKFCPRCGTPEDFVAVMEAYEADAEANRMRMEAEIAEESRIREEYWNRVEVATKLMNVDLKKAGFEGEIGDEDSPNEIVITRMYNGKGYTFRIHAEEVG